MQGGVRNSTFYTVRSGPTEEPTSPLKLRTSGLKPTRLEAIKKVYMEVG